MNVDKVIFLGSGTSGQIPSVTCLTVDNPTCTACLDSVATPLSKNRRRNTSILVQTKHRVTGITRNIVIDVGKSFYGGALEWFPKYGIKSIDAVILTHEHADAILGLDDLRDWTINRDELPPIPIYLCSKTMAVVSRVFPYLIDVGKATGSGLVPRLKFIVIDPPKPFEVEGIVFAPFSVSHGTNCTSLGFRFANVTYISDVSAMEEKDFQRIHGSDVFIIDALKDEPHVSHLSLSEAVEKILQVEPPVSRAYLTGMCHLLEHNHGNKILHKKKQKLDIVTDMELAYDGLILNVAENRSQASIETEAVIVEEFKNLHSTKLTSTTRHRDTATAILSEAESVADTALYTLNGLSQPNDTKFQNAGEMKL